MKKYVLFLLILSIISLIPAREILSMVKPDSLEAEKLYKKAEDYWRDVRYDSSNFYYEKASSLFQENKDWERYIDCQNNIGANYRYLGNFAEAISHLNMGIDAINNLDENQDSLRIKLYNNIGFVYFEMGYYDKAYKYYSGMLEISERVFGTKDINTGRGYQNIGLIYYSTGDYAQALRYLDKAYSIFSADSEKYNIQLANCYTSYSKIYLSEKDYSRSIEYEEKAIKIWIDKLGESHPYIAVSYKNLADTYGERGNYNKALEYDYKAMQIRRDFAGEESVDVAESYADIGNVFAKMGNFNNGRYFLNKSIAIYNKIAPANPGLADAYIFSGDLNRVNSDFKYAEAYYDSALYLVWPDYQPGDISTVVPDDIPFEEQSVRALIGKGNALFAEATTQSELGKALDFFILSSRLIEKLKTSSPKRYSEIITTKRLFEANKNGVLAAVKLFGLTNNPDYIESAFQLAEANKAGYLSESIALSDIKKFTGVPDSLIIKENELKADISLFQSKLTKAEISNDEQAIASNRNMLVNSQDKFDGLIKYYENNFPSYYRLKYFRKITSTNDISKLLPPDAALLEYFTGDTTITIFALSNGAASAVTIPFDSSFMEDVTKLRQSLPDSNYINYLTSAFNLYSKLIDPVKSFLKNRDRLFIIPDKMLVYLPFEALLTRPRPGVFNADFKDLPYLVNSYSISYHYSAGLLRDALLNKSSHRNKSFAVFLSVHSDKKEINKTASGSDISKSSSNAVRRNILITKKYSLLPETEEQVKSISELFKENDYDTRIFTDKTSINNQMRADKIFNYKIIHLAAQAFINDKVPGISGLVFYDPDDSTGNGLLYAGDIYDYRLISDLVVISRCEMDLRNIVNGEGFYALIRSILYTGAENIVIPTWLTAYKPAYAFMTGFYENILDGMPYDTALRKTKIDMIQGGQYSYPLNWSSYVLIGN